MTRVSVRLEFSETIFQSRSNQQSKTFPRLQNLNDYDRQQWWEKKKKGGAIRSFLFTWESAPALLVHSPAPQKSVISICSNFKKEGFFINLEKTSWQYWFSEVNINNLRLHFDLVQLCSGVLVQKSWQGWFVVHCAMFNVQCSMCNVQCSMFNVQLCMLAVLELRGSGCLWFWSQVLNHQPSHSLASYRSQLLHVLAVSHNIIALLVIFQSHSNHMCVVPKIMNRPVLV